jgi:primosomal protein N' (replication factor Y)
MANKITKFVDVILPVAVPNLYTYRVPFDWKEEIDIGKRVIVQFGKKRLYSAIIANIHEIPPAEYQAKYIESVLDENPIVNSIQINLWKWISEYYMCTIGEVMNAALPTGLKLISTTKILLNQEIILDVKALSDKEYLVVEALQIKHVLEMKDVESILDIKTVYPIIKALIDKEVVLVAEQLSEKYKPKLEGYISLPPNYKNEQEIKLIFEKLERAPKQLEVFMVFMQQAANDFDFEIIKSKLIKIATSTTPTVSSIIKKGFLTETKKEKNRIQSFDGDIKEKKELTNFQEKAYEEIKGYFKENKPALLHGITGSGKTEIYVKLIQEQLEQNNKVLYLLPEIALTTQIISRLKKFFGDKIGIYHSRFNANERVEVWNELLKKEKSRFQIIIGARSSIFLPFSNLGLIIIDEEHDASFKQYDPAPRYNGRDVAIYLSNIHKSKVLLGSATPAIETYYNAKEGKYGLVELTKRFGDIKLPEILCSDIQEATKKKKMTSHFSKFLLDYMKEYLSNGEQIILFQNRRGYNPFWSCEDCGWAPQCKNCDVSMTYHKYSHLLKCHYCGYAIKPVSDCRACGSSKIKMNGFGTEKIEDELSVLLPDKVIKRMDLDTTRNKNGYQNIIDAFENKEIDILVGTQMVTKGLDFDNVGLVGVLNADTLLHYPDFRSFERSFQLLTQVSGRSGRKGKRGKVVIQTYSPNHWVIQKVIQNDYLGMYKQEILERRNFKYPPFYRLIKITIKHRDKYISLNGSKLLAESLKKKLKERVLGPETPHISRVKNLYINQIVIKYEKNLSPTKLKAYLTKAVKDFKKIKDYKSAIIVMDVDFYG